VQFKRAPRIHVKPDHIHLQDRHDPGRQARLFARVGAASHQAVLFGVEQHEAYLATPDAKRRGESFGP
jgi:hypothetical protein